MSSTENSQPKSPKDDFRVTIKKFLTLLKLIKEQFEGLKYSMVDKDVEKYSFAINRLEALLYHSQKAHRVNMN